MSQSSNTEKQYAILDAAQKRFAHYGLQKVTMDEIASDLGISKAALYYYFTTKEEIFRQVIIRELHEFTDKMKLLLEQESSAVSKFKTYILHFHDFFNELVNLKLITGENHPGVNPVLRDLFRQFSTKEFDLIRNIIELGSCSGEITVESVDQIAQLTVHILQGLRIRYYKFQFGSEEERKQVEIQTEIRLLADILLNGIQKRNITI